LNSSMYLIGHHNKLYTGANCIGQSISCKVDERHVLWTQRFFTPFLIPSTILPFACPQETLLSKFFYKPAEIYLHFSMGASMREMRCRYIFVVENSEGRTPVSLGHQS